MAYSIFRLLRLLSLLSFLLNSTYAFCGHSSNSSDRAALLEFKAENDGDNVLSNWNETTNFCSWKGVKCYDGPILDLWLRNFSLHGPISPFLSNLSCLRALDLSENSLEGPIPVSLGALASLLILDLSANMIESVIPRSFGMLKSLQYLNIARNRLRGKLPTTLFYNCTQLNVVDLSGNNLHGSLPRLVGSHLRDLENLILDSNNFTGSLPDSLSNLTKIKMLELDANFLSGPLPPDLVAYMPQLEILHLSYNNLLFDESGSSLTEFFASISNLTHLAELGLAGNLIKSSLTTNIGLIHTNLSQVFLQDNLIYGPIPPSLSNISTLTLVNLSCNFLNGTIPPGLLRLPKLERLFLSNNRLEGEIPPIEISTNLGLLDLSSNRLSGQIPESISNLNQLRYLVLNRNSLVGSIPSSLGGMKLEWLDLSQNQLSGSIPEEVSGSSTKLRYLNLSSNLLNRIFPVVFSNMDQAQVIDLSKNNLSGIIPPSIESCREIEILNLSHNSLRGLIPVTLSNLKSLQALDVSFNQLSGEVPASLLQCSSLKNLNLSHNSLSGKLPQGGLFDSLPFDSLAGNEFCGPRGFPRCPVADESVTHSHGLLVSVVCIVSASLFLLTVFFAVRQNKVRSATDSRRNVLDLAVSHRRITYRELSEATGGFEGSRLIGSGSFGRVYKAILNDGSFVAVKVLQLLSSNSTRTFRRECQVLKCVRHRNLMRIITACVLEDFKALVLPYMTKGSLESLLHPQKRESASAASHLSLTERVCICSDVAEGMAYLHHHAPVQVIHCDLKPSNILLSEDMTALVSDFGIAKLVEAAAGGSTSATSASSTANLLRGSVGYVAPEYGYGMSASTKGDVYSFGIVVLETVTRKKPTDEMFDELISLPNWVKNEYRRNLDRVIDPSLLTDLLGQDARTKVTWEVVITELIDLGLLCTQEVPSTRPTMIDATDNLNKLKQYLAVNTMTATRSTREISSSKFAGGDY
ncbi:putative leucine-rich repeat receptor-like serine/threonine-protein kinase [Ananas comosus]|uniref:non-specific serine/threonine protein kinase n=1 Tax=Ananas comosus TaxID=4615 RepID=A0A199UYZ6_ANACO|nr:putative leucine-rich repeat receptor-like serine/threonine-protein kinase [Ananas comosus]